MEGGAPECCFENGAAVATCDQPELLHRRFSLPATFFDDLAGEAALLGNVTRRREEYANVTRHSHLWVSRCFPGGNIASGRHLELIVEARSGARAIPHFEDFGGYSMELFPVKNIAPFWGTNHASFE